MLLADVESKDTNTYQFILVFIPQGSNEPFLYITSEKNEQPATEGGSHRIRVIAPHNTQVFGSNDRWADEEAFTEDALLMGRKLLELTDEEAYRIE